MSAYRQALVSLQKLSKAQLEKLSKRKLSESEVRIFKAANYKYDDTAAYIRGLEREVIELNSVIASLREQEQEKL
ncbi:MAG: hypothetical protein QOK23_2907 [Gammaproteobacteria bacterium]|jgi:hypothetical protein|nr:hypothetical protein [Gammaproteobacteria bacterium]